MSSFIFFCSSEDISERSMYPEWFLSIFLKTFFRFSRMRPPRECPDLAHSHSCSRSCRAMSPTSSPSSSSESRRRRRRRPSSESSEFGRGERGDRDRSESDPSPPTLAWANFTKSPYTTMPSPCLSKRRMSFVTSRSRSSKPILSRPSRNRRRLSAPSPLRSRSPNTRSNRGLPNFVSFFRRRISRRKMSSRSRMSTSGRRSFSPRMKSRYRQWPGVRPGNLSIIFRASRRPTSTPSFLSPL